MKLDEALEKARPAGRTRMARRPGQIVFCEPEGEIRAYQAGTVIRLGNRLEAVDAAADDWEPWD